MHKLPRSFYDRDTTVVARELLGKLLVRVESGRERIGKIVEVEAYLGPHDLAAHSSRGLTERTRVMFGPPGHAYVYFIYGMYHCLNVVTEREGHAAAVLLRALEPVKNLEGRTSGPGLLCRAMHVDRRLNGHDLLSDDFFITTPSEDRTVYDCQTAARGRGLRTALGEAAPPVLYQEQSVCFTALMIHPRHGHLFTGCRSGERCDIAPCRRADVPSHHSPWTWETPQSRARRHVVQKTPASGPC